MPHTRYRFLKLEILVLTCLLAIWGFRSESNIAKAEVLRQVVETDRETLNTFRYLASHYRLAGPKKATKTYEEIVRLDPTDAEAWVELGDAHWECGQHQTALDAYNRAATLRPDWAWPNLVLALSYGDLQRHEEAIEAYNRVITLHPDMSGLYVLLGDLQVETGCPNEGLVAYQHSIALKPGNATARLHLATAYLQRDDKELALKEYEVLKTLDQGSTSAYVGGKAIILKAGIPPLKGQLETRTTYAPQGR